MKEQLKQLRKEFALYRIQGDKALDENNMPAHMENGRRYHETADKIKELTGVDPRPQF